MRFDSAPLRLGSLRGLRLQLLCPIVLDRCVEVHDLNSVSQMWVRPDDLDTSLLSLVEGVVLRENVMSGVVVYEKHGHHTTQ